MNPPFTHREDLSTLFLTHSCSCSLLFFLSSPIPLFSITFACGASSSPTVALYIRLLSDLIATVYHSQKFFRAGKMCVWQKIFFLKYTVSFISVKYFYSLTKFEEWWKKSTNKQTNKQAKAKYYEIQNKDTTYLFTVHMKNIAYCASN